MKELVVISGKGGTGKTSIVGAFAAIAERKVLVDCDVDAADLHLLLNPAIVRRETFVAGHEAVIREHDCCGCGGCADVCRYGAIHVDGRGDRDMKYKVDPLACEGCGVCVSACPLDAIDFPECEIGEWFVSETRHGPLVHARLGVGAENSGKLVTVVRQTARGIANQHGLDLIIVDGPPGIGCPVIASVTGASLVLVVTEPTLSGAHDLKRVAELTRHFKIPTAVCINKWDINPKLASQIADEAVAEGIQVVGKIAYDPDVTQAQIAGQNLVDFQDNDTAREIKEMWLRVEELMDREVMVG